MDCQGKTIKDFGVQWLQYRDNDGFYGSSELFWDMFASVLTPEELRGCRVAEIGSGTGRIVHMLLRAGAAHVTAIEPSDAFDVLVENTRNEGSRVNCLKMTGEKIPENGNYDFVFSVGVIHHIPEPAPVMKAAFRSLRRGGRLAIWLYGREGNELYLGLIHPLRLFTTRLPHFWLAVLSRLISWPLALYIFLCRFFSLPLKDYMNNVIGPMTPEKRRLVIYDQLNPAHAKYYRKDEVMALITEAGFTAITINSRHGYSWSAVGTRP